VTPVRESLFEPGWDRDPDDDERERAFVDVHGPQRPVQPAPEGPTTAPLSEFGRSAARRRTVYGPYLNVLTVKGGLL
jgi:hypothetical protein